MIMKNNYLTEVENTINSAPAKWRSDDIVFLKKYIGTQYDILGLSIPYIRSLSKKGFTFSTLEPEDQIEVWNEIWLISNSHEALTLAILFWEKHINKISAATSWNYLKGWTSKIDNWAHSDGLSGLYSYLLEINPSLILPQLKKWNKSKNSWERRQSVVGLIHYHRKRSKVLPYIALIPFVESLLDDKDYFVQKGVGWALREISNVYPKQTYGFMRKNHSRLKSVAFAAATEKLSKPEKEKLKELRKLARKK